MISPIAPEFKPQLIQDVEVDHRQERYSKYRSTLDSLLEYSKKLDGYIEYADNTLKGLQHDG